MEPSAKPSAKPSERLEAALARLETAAGKTAASGGSKKMMERVAALTAERDRLADALALAERERAKIKAANAAIASRLDNAIGEIKSVLAR
jgi:phage I-like protein